MSGGRGRAWLREPLLHFLGAGALLFAIASWTGAPAPRAEGRIVVTAATVERLAADWTRVRLRPPTPAELDGLVEEHVREEIMVREAMALGLARDDTIIRRRLRQKLEFVSEDLTAPPEPTERDLEAYLAAHGDAFRQEPRYTFRHVFLSSARRGAALARDGAQLLAELRQSGETAGAEERGDPFLLPFEFRAAPPAEIAKAFGEEFAGALQALATGTWQGPVRSAYGVHLVLVEERLPGRLPALAEVRGAVRREWMATARHGANEAFYRALRARYTVSVDRSSASAPVPPSGR